MQNVIYVLVSVVNCNCWDIGFDNKSMLKNKYTTFTNINSLCSYLNDNYTDIKDAEV